MIAFEVSLNGKRVCTAGVPDFGVLSAILSWVRRRPDHSRGGKTIEEELTADVGGLHSEASGPGEHLKWFRRTLRVDDRVSVRVIDTGKVDEPTTRYRDNPATVARAKRRYYERLKGELEGTSVKVAPKKGAAPDRGREAGRAKHVAPRRRRGG